MRKDLELPDSKVLKQRASTYKIPARTWYAGYLWGTCGGGSITLQRDFPVFRSARLGTEDGAPTRTASRQLRASTEKSLSFFLFILFFFFSLSLSRLTLLCMKKENTDHENNLETKRD